MTEEMLNWMNKNYPDGFYCADIRNVALNAGGTPALPALSMLNAPLLFHMQSSQLQDLVGNLIAHGMSPHAVFHLPEQNVSGTLGDVVLRVRSLSLDTLFLVITE